MKIIYADELAREAVRRGALPSFEGRIRDMARHALCAEGHPNHDHVDSPCVGLRVARNWPARGSITITRDDGERRRLVLKAHVFRVEVA